MKCQNVFLLARPRPHCELLTDTECKQAEHSDYQMIEGCIIAGSQELQVCFKETYTYVFPGNEYQELPVVGSSRICS